MAERSEERRHKVEAERFRRLSGLCEDPKLKLKLRQLAAMHGAFADEFRAPNDRSEERSPPSDRNAARSGF
jgi:hypothetical protein